MSLIQITDVARCGALVMSHFKKGVSTNNFLTTEDYQREIQAGTLFLHQFEGGILFLRRRPTHYIGNFHLLPDAVPTLEALDLPVAVEISSRKEPDTAPWLPLGFQPILHRKRFSATEGISSPSPVRLAKLEESEAIKTLLTAQFDPITGCLPTQLEQEIVAGNMLVLEQNGQIIGVCHRTISKNTGEIRHLAVETTRRGEGLSRQLMAGYFAHTPTKKHQVWTANPIAEHLYTSCGYTADGYTSTVLIKEGTPL